jgi:hypothetical protein
VSEGAGVVGLGARWGGGGLCHTRPGREGLVHTLGERAETGYMSRSLMQLGCRGKRCVPPQRGGLLSWEGLLRGPAWRRRQHMTLSDIISAVTVAAAAAGSRGSVCTL